MAEEKESLYASLKRAFHEPNRLAILSQLSGVSEGVIFNDLRDQCGLTDGNLSRHLKVLEEEGAVVASKFLQNGRARTIVRLTDTGRHAFVAYLGALESVLRRAESKLAARGEEAVDSVAGGVQSRA